MPVCRASARPNKLFKFWPPGKLLIQKCKAFYGEICLLSAQTGERIALRATRVSGASDRDTAGCPEEPSFFWKKSWAKL